MKRRIVLISALLAPSLAVAWTEIPSTWQKCKNRINEFGRESVSCKTIQVSSRIKVSSFLHWNVRYNSFLQEL